MYGRFTLCSFCGSVIGAIAYIARMLQLRNSLIFSSIENSTRNPSLDDLLRMTAYREEGRRWTAAFYALFPFELAFVIVAKLMVGSMQHMAFCGPVGPLFFQSTSCFFSS
jgi:hypothetical protein